MTLCLCRTQGVLQTYHHLGMVAIKRSVSVMHSNLASATFLRLWLIKVWPGARMSITIVRATHLCIHGSRIPTSKMSNRLPQWEDKAVLLGLFRY
jgi:hypothetical protein